jgi:hypothetical protein
VHRIGERRGTELAVVGAQLSLRAAATTACRPVVTPLIRLLGRTGLLIVTRPLRGVLCAGIALPVPLWALAPMPAALGLCLRAGQRLSMATVVRAASDRARSTAPARCLTGNRLGRVAAPAPPSPDPVAGVAGAAAPFVTPGALLLASGVVAVRTGRPVTGGTGGGHAPQSADEGGSPGRHTHRVR